MALETNFTIVIQIHFDNESLNYFLNTTSHCPVSTSPTSSSNPSNSLYSKKKNTGPQPSLLLSLLLLLLRLGPGKSPAQQHVHDVVAGVVRVLHHLLVEDVHGEPRLSSTALRRARFFPTLSFAAFARAAPITTVAVAVLLARRFLSAFVRHCGYIVVLRVK